MGMEFSSEEGKGIWVKWCKFWGGLFVLLVVFIFEICYANPTLDIYTESYIGWVSVGVMGIYYIAIYWYQTNKSMNSDE